MSGQDIDLQGAKTRQIIFTEFVKQDPSLRQLQKTTTEKISTLNLKFVTIKIEIKK